MFSILMGSVLDRLQHVHGEASWAAYFKRQYLCQAAGPGGMLSAVWWAGVLSKIQPGYPPSQQCAEQLNTKVKRDMETLPRETHAQVCQSLEKVIGTWSATLKQGEEMLDTPKLALTAPSRQIGMDRPPEPDDWMIHGKSHVLLKPGAIQKRFPSIPVILQQMRTLNSAGTSPFFESVPACRW